MLYYIHPKGKEERSMHWQDIVAIIKDLAETAVLSLTAATLIKKLIKQRKAKSKKKGK